MREAGRPSTVIHCGRDLAEDAASRSLVASMRPARKRERVFDVRFATQACEIETREGPVHADPGDAIVTGLGGERWPVRPEAFAHRYCALVAADEGRDGAYRSRPIDVRAIRMREPFTVLDPAAGLRLHGRVGDWLVEYRPGDFAIVDDGIFNATYEFPGTA